MFLLTGFKSVARGLTSKGINFELDNYLLILYCHMIA